MLLLSLLLWLPLGPAVAGDSLLTTLDAPCVIIATLPESPWQAEWMLEPQNARSLRTANLYSYGGTLALVGTGGLLLLVDQEVATIGGSVGLGAGLLLGPSLGQFYLGDTGRAAFGMGIRVGGIALGVLIGQGAAANSGDGVSEFLIASTVGVILGSAFNFATLPDSAREQKLTVSPSVDRTSGQPMLALRLEL